MILFAFISSNLIPLSLHPPQTYSTVAFLPLLSIQSLQDIPPYITTSFLFPAHDLQGFAFCAILTVSRPFSTLTLNFFLLSFILSAVAAFIFPLFPYSLPLRWLALSHLLPVDSARAFLAFLFFYLKLKLTASLKLRYRPIVHADLTVSFFSKFCHRLQYFHSSIVAIPRACFI